MTKKKRQPVKSIEKLSDDLKGHRALKGSKQRIPVAIATIDRWIQKAEALERRVEHWSKRYTQPANVNDAEVKAQDEATTQ